MNPNQIHSPLDYYGGTQSSSFFDNLKSHIIDFIQTLVVFGAIFALIYLLVAQPHKVSGRSMVPTFQDGDYIFTDKLTYRFREPMHGEVVVLKNPRDESEDFIKRIIALPGDSIKIENSRIYVNGQPTNESYLPADTPTRSGSFLNEGIEVNAANNQYFVIGDNRDHSSDSREWGPITKEEIIGKVFFRYWPPQSFGIFKSP